MSARFEVVRTSAEQPWHVRLIVNGRITWRVENLTRRVGAERAIVSALREIAGEDWELRWNVEGREKVAVNEVGQVHHLLVTYIDNRPAQIVPVIEWPVYHSQIQELRRGGGVVDYWHDRDTHYRNCTDECDEAIPPAGVEVHCRFGKVTVTKKMLAAAR